jgi:hypothetical protein
MTIVKKKFPVGFFNLISGTNFDTQGSMKRLAPIEDIC